MKKIVTLALGILLMAAPAYATNLLLNGNQVQYGVTTTVPDHIPNQKSTIPGVTVYSPSKVDMWDPLVDPLPIAPLTGAVVPAPTGQSQYGVTPTAGFQSDGVTANTGAVICTILKPAAGNLYYIRGYASAATNVQIYDSATIPADGTLTPKSAGGTWIENISIPAAGDWLRTMNGGFFPEVHSAGITACYSSTSGFVKTQLGSAGTNWMIGGVY